VRTFRGGARFNWLGGTWPFGRLGIDESGISVALFERKYFIRRSDIVEVLETRVFLSRAVQIRHRAPDVPDDLILFFPIRKEIERRFGQRLRGMAIGCGLLETGSRNQRVLHGPMGRDPSSS
jgi:hypothetical protein